MPDLMDRVQQHADDLASDALAKHASRVVQAGRSNCANHDCGEPIHPERTALGAQLCMDCQIEEDGKQAHFAKWKGR